MTAIGSLAPGSCASGVLATTAEVGHWPQSLSKVRPRCSSGDDRGAPNPDSPESATNTARPPFGLAPPRSCSRHLGRAEQGRYSGLRGDGNVAGSGPRKPALPPPGAQARLGSTSRAPTRSALPKGSGNLSVTPAKGLVRLADTAGSLANPIAWAANPSANIERVKCTFNTGETSWEDLKPRQPDELDDRPTRQRATGGCTVAPTSFDSDPAKFGRQEGGRHHPERQSCVTPSSRDWNLRTDGAGFAWWPDHQVHRRRVMLQAVG
jgi:hypothetical protein